MYNIVIVFVLCVRTHVYENALLFFLNVKHGASQLYLGRGASNYLAPALLGFCSYNLHSALFIQIGLAPSADDLHGLSATIRRCNLST